MVLESCSSLMLMRPQMDSIADSWSIIRLDAMTANSSSTPLAMRSGHQALRDHLKCVQTLTVGLVCVLKVPDFAVDAASSSS